MRVFLVTLLLFFFTVGVRVEAEHSVLLHAGIELSEMLPDEFFGGWRISSNLIETNAHGLFKRENVDLWNISRKNNVITLNNPFSGANASILIKEINDNKIVFEKNGVYDNKKLNDVVEIYLDGDSFRGYNYIEFVTVSDVDGRVMKIQTAKYSLSGDKISGDNVFE